MRCLFWLNLLMLVSCSADNTTIKIKGSDTEVNLAVQLAESFHSTNPGLFVSISGGGSGLGIASLMNGTADLANSSRSINDLELKLFHQRGINLDSFIFAQDAIAFVVSSSLTIDSITPAELAAILKGSLKNWSSLTGKDLPVNIYGRQSNSGTHDFVKKKLGIDFSPHAKEMNGNAQILEALKSDNSGIGYVGAGYVIHGGSKGIKVLTVYETKNSKAVSPLDAAMIAAGKYYFQRPLFQYYKTGSFEKVKPILDFEKSTSGQKIIRDAGYYPVN
ncbi:PstS family phosphate ABC transporter substrate-binding protein [Ferruginibacter paludis]|uniref:PstS family phosphate ABC transporter substrate-binding protein n=1 Tax=Ferruginibacter paludis TaxID=1310417 RepID=UPI0025B53C8E|nr:PstS family phosphate ABC transporter substrate-binding protein [Ferruginibacter paludis]MDN3656723.1 PstS family phosphate ABC transporter substrate-binding protein [Ferruginibacter paludis]